MIKHLFIGLLFLFIYNGCAQAQKQDYLGNWEGRLADSEAFTFQVSLEPLNAKEYQLTLGNAKTLINQKVQSSSSTHIQFQLDQGLKFNFTFQDNKKRLSGFIQSGILMYHLTLTKMGSLKYTGSWKPFMVERLQPQAVYLSVEKNQDGSMALYPFFADQRFTGTWCTGFQKEGEVVRFRDFKTGMQFKAQLRNDKIQLDALLGEALVCRSTLTRSKEEWQFGRKPDSKDPKQDQSKVLSSSLQKYGYNEMLLSIMADSIRSQTFKNVHSVLIAKDGQLTYEKYFNDYAADIPHDQRSGSKSIASAMIGIAIDEGKIKHVGQKLYDFLPERYAYTIDALKSEITLRDLLTMSSGFEISRESGASEGNYQNTNDWLKSVLEAPMQDKPGTHANYGSANPYLLGVCLHQRLNQPMELYMDQKLLAPLGITNYIIQSDETGAKPYFGGGMYLTPRDMIKFGQLYLNKGQWEGQQVISQNWVKDSFAQHFNLENVRDKNGYGYQWWHKTYEVDGEQYPSVEARGNGGQYIFVIPKLNTVVVITSGNYNNGQLIQQPEKILEAYILPAIKN